MKISPIRNEKDYQKAIDVNPGRNDATFYHYLGCAKFQLKRPIGDILNCFDNSIKYNKNDDAFSLRLSDTYYMRAAARLSDEKFSDAKKDIEKAFELDPKDDAIHRLKNEIEDILKNTSQNNNNKVESVTDIKKTDKFLWIKKWITFILRIRIANYRYLKFNNGSWGKVNLSK